MFKIIGYLMVSALIGSVAQSAETTYTESNKPVVPQAPAQRAISLSDPEILGIVHAINKMDIQTGEMAQKKANQSAVQMLGSQTVKDHQRIEQRLQNLQSKTGMAPKESEMSKKLLQEGESRISTLQKLEGKMFEQEYLRHEVEFHSKVIASFSKELIPNAENPELEEYLRDGLTTMKMHYQRAGTTLNMMEDAEGVPPK